MRTHTAGQALVMVALILPALLGVLLVGVEVVSRRSSERAVRAAIQAANRSAVQTFDYATFANNRLALGDADAVIAVARRLAAVNLQQIPGLTLPPARSLGFWRPAPPRPTLCCWPLSPSRRASRSRPRS